MEDIILVQIIGAPVACGDGVKDSWREVAVWVAGQLKNRYGDGIHVEYFDLFDPASPPLPPEIQLPLVLVNGAPVINGGKISIPKICKHIELIRK